MALRGSKQITCPFFVPDIIRYIYLFIYIRQRSAWARALQCDGLIGKSRDGRDFPWGGERVLTRERADGPIAQMRNSRTVVYTPHRRNLCSPSLVATHCCYAFPSVYTCTPLLTFTALSTVSHCSVRFYTGQIHDVCVYIYIYIYIYSLHIILIDLPSHLHRSIKYYVDLRWLGVHKRTQDEYCIFTFKGCCRVLLRNRDLIRIINRIGTTMELRKINSKLIQLRAAQ
jgi:hypothetical protein